MTTIQSRILKNLLNSTNIDRGREWSFIAPSQTQTIFAIGIGTGETESNSLFFFSLTSLYNIPHRKIVRDTCLLHVWPKRELCHWHAMRAWRGSTNQRDLIQHHFGNKNIVAISSAKQQCSTNPIARLRAKQKINSKNPFLLFWYDRSRDNLFFALTHYEIYNQ